LKKNIDKKRLKNKTNNNQKNKDQIKLKKIKGQEREKREENKKVHVNPSSLLCTCATPLEKSRRDASKVFVKKVFGCGTMDEFF
jgi:hypothetical protein